MIENDIIFVKKAENDALELIKKTRELKDVQIVKAREENEKIIRTMEDQAFQAADRLIKESTHAAERDAERLLYAAEKESEKISSVQSSTIACSVRVIVSKITGVKDVLPVRDEPYHDRSS